MKFSTLLAAALFSTVVVIPFLPTAQPGPEPFFLDARITASVDTTVRIYYDIGRGYNEGDSQHQPVGKDEPPRLCRFAIPGGRYRSLRIDPVESAGTAVFHGPLRIVSASGRPVRDIALAELRALQQIESRREAAGRLEVVAGSTANDPQLVVELSPPLRVAGSVLELGRALGQRALPVFVALGLLLLGWERAARLRAAAARVVESLRQRPARALALVAAAAVGVSAYPVLFLGKSFVGPNLGCLLYENIPTLPGDERREAPEPNGSDLGPALWQNVPYAFVQRRALAQGELPLWNRHALTGAPLLGQGQSMFGDPLHALVLLFDSAAWAWDLKYLIAKWLFAFGIGLTVLALLAQGPKDQGTKGPKDLPSADGPLVPWSFGPLVPSTFGPLVPASLVALAAPFIGFFAYRINHPAFFSLCYAPWVLLGWIQLNQASDRRAVTGWLAGLGLANFALLHSGTAKEAALLALQMNLAGAGVLLTCANPWRARLVRLAVAAWTGLLVLLLAAPTWGTFRDALRHAFTASTATGADQIQPALLVGAFDELFYRPLSRGDVVFNPSLNFLLLLGLLYFTATIRRHFAHRAAMVLAAAAAVAIGMAFGVVPADWIARVPLLGQVGHIDNCFTCGLIVFGSALAGIGFAAAAERLARREGRGDLAIVALLLAALVAAWLGFRQAAHRELFGPGTTFSPLRRGQEIPVDAFVWGGIAALLLASAMFALVARRALARRSLTPALAILAALAIVVLLWRHGMHAAALGFDPYVVQPAPRGDFHARSPAIAFIQQRHAQAPGRVFGIHGNLTPNWQAVYGLEAIHGPDALQNAPLRQLIDVSPAKWGSMWRVYVSSPDLAAVRPFFDALNVRHYVDLASNPPVADSAVALVHRSDLEVYESRTAWPRAFFASTLTTYADPADLVKKILASEGRPFAAVSRADLAAHPTLGPLPLDDPAPLIVPATDYRLTENSTTFRVRAPSAGVVVLTEAWWPDAFRAEINGRRTPVVRINHAFKGVALPAPGDYLVTFSYWPKHFTRYLGLAAAGGLLAAGSLLFGLRRRGAALAKDNPPSQLRPVPRQTA